MLARVVSVVLQGELWIRRSLVAKLVDSLVAKEADTDSATGRFAILTPREIEIARLIGQGASNKRIARHLAITERTVKGHLTAIFRKTGAVDRLTFAPDRAQTLITTGCIARAEMDAHRSCHFLSEVDNSRHPRVLECLVRVFGVTYVAVLACFCRAKDST